METANTEKTTEQMETAAPEPDTNALVDDLACDYAHYLNFDISKEQSKFSESIEELLTKLDEFCGLVDMIRSDTSLCLNKTLPAIQARCQEMEQIFAKVDKLEAFTGVVKECVNNMEVCVNKADEEFSSFGGIMKKLSSLVGSKKSTPKPPPVYTAPAIFVTNDYFPPASEAEQPPNPEDAASPKEDEGAAAQS